MRGLPVDGYEIIKANKKEVCRDAFFSMELVYVYRINVSGVRLSNLVNLENIATLLLERDAFVRNDQTGCVTVTKRREGCRIPVMLTMRIGV